jgi:hypothetical protein
VRKCESRTAFPVRSSTTILYGRRGQAADGDLSGRLLRGAGANHAPFWSRFDWGAASRRKGGRRGDAKHGVTERSKPVDHMEGAMANDSSRSSGDRVAIETLSVRLRRCRIVRLETDRTRAAAQLDRHLAGEVDTSPRGPDAEHRGCSQPWTTGSRRY